MNLEQVRRGDAVTTLGFGEAASLARAVYVQARDGRVRRESDGALELLVMAEA